MMLKLITDFQIEDSFVQTPVAFVEITNFTAKDSTTYKVQLTFYGDLEKSFFIKTEEKQIEAPTEATLLELYQSLKEIFSLKYDSMLV